MLKYARSRGLKKLNLNTNATLMTGAISEALLDCDLEQILVSLDAHSQAAYDRIRVGGNFAQTVANVEGLLSASKRRQTERPSIVVQFIVMDENAHEETAFREFWLERCAIVKTRLRLGWGHGVAAPDLAAAEVRRDFPCPWLLRTMSIHWSGEVAQCDADFEGNASAGNINDQTLVEVWRGELKRRRDRHWNLDFEHPLCKECYDWSVGRSTIYHPPGARTKA
jgi:radical SAM protein with 4Fe4S-binding SPASM domain